MTNEWFLIMMHQTDVLHIDTQFVDKWTAWETEWWGNERTLNNPEAEKWLPEGLWLVTGQWKKQ
jgi:hypothetical protein